MFGKNERYPARLRTADNRVGKRYPGHDKKQYAAKDDGQQHSFFWNMKSHMLRN